MPIYNLSGNSIQNSYNLSGEIVRTNYDVNGNAIYGGYSNYTITTLFNNGGASDWIQATAYYDGVIFQFTEGKFKTLDLTGASISSGYITDTTFGHANSVQFSNEFYDPTDRFPLLYVSTYNLTPNYTRVYRMTTTTATLIRSILMSTTEDGYCIESCIDSENGYLYTIGYKEDNPVTETAGNVIVITKRDLNNLVDNGSDIYTAPLLSRIECNYWLYRAQACTYYDGYIWATFGGGASPNNFYAINPNTGNKDYTMTIQNTVEPEGVAWVLDQSDSPWLLIGQQHNLYQKCIFN